MLRVNVGASLCALQYHYYIVSQLRTVTEQGIGEERRNMKQHNFRTLGMISWANREQCEDIRYAGVRYIGYSAVEEESQRENEKAVNNTLHLSVQRSCPRHMTHTKFSFKLLTTTTKKCQNEPICQQSTNASPIIIIHLCFHPNTFFFQM